MKKTQEALKLALEALENTTAEWRALADSGDAGVWKAEDQDDYKQCVEAITALREALAEQPAQQGGGNLPPPLEQQPVAWEDVLGAIARGWTHDDNKHKTMDVALAVAIAKEVQDMVTSSQARQWQGLTDEEIEGLLPTADGSAEENKVRVEVQPGIWGVEYEEVDAWSLPLVRQAIRAIEAKLREKNGGGV